MEAVKAKIIVPNDGEFEVVIYVGRMWRAFGTPYKDSKGYVSPFANEKTARKSADKIAAELGLELLWEGK